MLTTFTEYMIHTCSTYIRTRAHTDVHRCTQTCHTQHTHTHTHMQASAGYLESSKKLYFLKDEELKSMCSDGKAY